jgi:hypothetical protein
MKSPLCGGKLQWPVWSIIWDISWRSWKKHQSARLSVYHITKTSFFLCYGKDIKIYIWSLCSIVDLGYEFKRKSPLSKPKCRWKNSIKMVRFQALTATHMKMFGFWDVAQYTLVVTLMMTQLAPPERRSISKYTAHHPRRQPPQY